jgi:hypothetical protein
MPIHLYNNFGAFSRLLVKKLPRCLQLQHLPVYRTHMTLGQIFAQYLISYLSAYGQAKTLFLVHLKFWANRDFASFLVFYRAEPITKRILEFLTD